MKPEQLTKELRALVKQVQTRSRIAVFELANDLKQDLVSKTPYLHSTGRMKASWFVRRGRQGPNVIASREIFNDTPYAKHIEKGVEPGKPPWYSFGKTKRTTAFRSKIWSSQAVGGMMDPESAKDGPNAVFGKRKMNVRLSNFVQSIFRGIFS